MQPVSQCFACKHLDRDSVSGVMRCKAFSVIPMSILSGEVDHRAPFDGDGGITWEADTDEDGATMPHPDDYEGLLPDDDPDA